MGSLVELARKLRPKIEEMAQGLTDGEALQVKELYPEWRPDTTYKNREDGTPYKVRRNGKLYKLVTPHTSQTGWEPEIPTALWTEINEANAGTLEDPIPYDGNMALEQGKYYTQDGVVYLCVINTHNPVYHALKDLVGIYVKEVT